MIEDIRDRLQTKHRLQKSTLRVDRGLLDFLWFFVLVHDCSKKRQLLHLNVLDFSKDLPLAKYAAFSLLFSAFAPARASASAETASSLAAGVTTSISDQTLSLLKGNSRATAHHAAFAGTSWPAALAASRTLVVGVGRCTSIRLVFAIASLPSAMPCVSTLGMTISVVFECKWI